MRNLQVIGKQTVECIPGFGSWIFVPAICRRALSGGKIIAKIISLLISDFVRNAFLTVPV